MQQLETMWECTVPVATIWTSPESARPMDAAGIAEPLSMNSWLAAMDLEQRFALCKESRVQSQLLYGEPVIVESIDNGWAKIIAVWQPSSKDERGYPGFVPAAQLKEAVPLDDPEGVVRVDVPKCQVWLADRTPDTLVIPFNSILPLLGMEDGWAAVATPHGRRLLRAADIDTAPSIHRFKKKTAQEAAERAVDFLDLPYFWGGMSSYGYDCSGLTYNMMKASGMYISRDANDQVAEGEAVAVDEPESWRRGDLLFFTGENSGNITHVGFYYGDDQMIHATSSKSGTVELSKLENTPYAGRLCAVRRFSGQGQTL
ncbi:gamma-D-glutamyl-L-lysine endopeptidase [Sporosarcina sp. NCCP-2716]|uniref:C40 family peptidase n=1 Tax=Sporosarcina sp. NCCP-2716 TaxID=2943679 RepID=UPI0020400666|nr:C40 family peptidase [Sporosarcina sp. NCCP-2716]GKV68503.1 gamma-D-glutamyl-L-lysine endopeptidase [Sporosarcina sp. NCCP-2716]